MPLSVGDRDQRHFREFLVERDQIRQILSAMKGGYAWNVHPPAQREMKIIDVKVNEVEFVGLIENTLHHRDMMCQWIDTIRIEPKRLFTRRNQFGIGHRVAAGKQGHVVSE